MPATSQALMTVVDRCLPAENAAASGFRAGYQLLGTGDGAPRAN
jgi:hypothetical protein